MTEKTKRLDKFLTEMTDLTRTQAKEAARKGRIAVNGTVVRKTDGKISPETDTVTCRTVRSGYRRSASDYQ